MIPLFTNPTHSPKLPVEVVQYPFGSKWKAWKSPLNFSLELNSQSQTVISLKPNIWTVLQILPKYLSQLIPTATIPVPVTMSSCLDHCTGFQWGSPHSLLPPANLFSKLQTAWYFKNHKCDDVSATENSSMPSYALKIKTKILNEILLING